MLRFILIISLLSVYVVAQDMVCDVAPACSTSPSASTFKIFSQPTNDKMISSTGLVNAVQATGLASSWTAISGSSAVYINDGVSWLGSTRKYYSRIIEITCQPTYGLVYCKTMLGGSAKLYVNGIQVRAVNINQGVGLCAAPNAGTIVPIKVDRYWRLGTNIIEWEILNDASNTNKALSYEIRFFT